MPVGALAPAAAWFYSATMVDSQHFTDATADYSRLAPHLWDRIGTDAVQAADPNPVSGFSTHAPGSGPQHCRQPLLWERVAKSMPSTSLAVCSMCCASEQASAGWGRCVHTKRTC